jgi:tetrahydromethanopterin S-methyltransferase subunit C
VKGWLALTLGLLAVVVGAVWTLQGLGHLAGSVMTGVRVWAVVGPVVAVIGLALIWVGLRVRKRR